MIVVFEKGAPLRHIGHLDLMRAMQRALRRSGLPIAYSQGFNPHIRLSFAQPLGVGVIGMRELMEVPLVEDVAPQAFADAMNGVLPGLLRIRACRALDDGFPTLMSLVGGSRYLIRLEDSAEGRKALQALPGFMALTEYVTDRKTKSGEAPANIRPFVMGAEAVPDENGLAIRLTTIQNQKGALKPSLWMDSLMKHADAAPVSYTVYREAILSRDERGRLIPMEELL